MRNGFASVALVCTLTSPASLGGRRVVTSAAMRAQAQSPFAPFRRDLPRIPDLKPVRRTRTRDVYDITMREATAEILPGFQTPIYGYNGIYPGPTIRSRTGREAIVRQRNALPFDANVHLHGGSVPAAHDGHPMDLIPAGGSFDYRYPNEQDAASLWYHDHAHGRTARTLYYGLLAMYVLEDDLERELDLPRGAYDVPIVIADHAFNRDGSFRYADSIDVGFRGDTILVNGAVSPRMRVRRRKYRLRFLNASNSRSYTLRLGRGRPMTQIAGDGGLLTRPVNRTRVPLHPAERVDLVIDFRDYRRRAPSWCSTTRAAKAAPWLSCASTWRVAAAARTSASRAASASGSRCRPPTPTGGGSWHSACARGRSTAGSSTTIGST